MVLSKMDSGANVVGKPKSADVVSFLREYKTLECSCCSTLMGFQNRATGEIFCTPECSDEGVHRPPPIRSPMASVVVPPASVVSVAAPEVRKDACIGRGGIPAEPAVLRQPAVSVCPSMAAPAEIIKPAAAAEQIARPTAPANFFKNGNLAPEPAAEQIARPTAPANFFKNGNSAPEPAAIVPPKPLAPANFFNPSEPMPPAVNPFMKHIPSFSKNAESERKRFMWTNCQITKSLNDAAAVKATFVYNVSKLQIVACADEGVLMKYQQKLNDYVKAAGTDKGAVPLTRIPVADELVLGEYAGEYYRARIKSVAGDKCTVDFVDFGDTMKDVDVYSLFEINDDLASAPIWSLCVELDTVKRPEKKVKMPSAMQDTYYKQMKLELVEPIDLSRQEVFRVVLWMSQDKSLNHLANEFLDSLNMMGNDEHVKLEDFKLWSENLKRIANHIERNIKSAQHHPTDDSTLPFAFALDEANLRDKYEKLAALSSTNESTLGEILQNYLNMLKEEFISWSKERMREKNEAPFNCPPKYHPFYVRKLRVNSRLNMEEI